jgi:hypothetical protein
MEWGKWLVMASTKKKIEPYRFVLGGFGLGPGTDISRTSPSGGLKFMLGVGMAEVRLGLIPNLAMGSIADVSGPASPGGDSLVLRVGNVNGWLDVRGVEISDVGITSPSCRVTGRVTKGVTVSDCMQERLGMGRVLTGEQRVQERIQCRQRD